MQSQSYDHCLGIQFCTMRCSRLLLGLVLSHQATAFIPEAILAGLVIKKIVDHKNRQECAAVVSDCESWTSTLEGDVLENKAVLEKQMETYLMLNYSLTTYREHPDKWDCSYKDRPPVGAPPKLRSREEPTPLGTDHISPNASSSANATSPSNSTSSANATAPTGSAPPSTAGKHCEAYDVCHSKVLSQVTGIRNQAITRDKQNDRTNTVEGLLRDCTRIKRPHLEARNLLTTVDDEYKQLTVMIGDCQQRLTQTKSFHTQQINILENMRRDAHHPESGGKRDIEPTMRDQPLPELQKRENKRIAGLEQRLSRCVRLK